MSEYTAEFEDILSKEYRRGYAEGEEDGYEKGHNDGYNDGFAEGHDEQCEECNNRDDKVLQRLKDVLDTVVDEREGGFEKLHNAVERLVDDIERGRL